MKNIEELKNIIDRFYVKYSALTSEVEDILLSCGASYDDSSDEGYFAGMSDSQIETCYSKIRDLIKHRHENVNPDYFTEDTLVDFDLQDLVLEESFSIYDRMNKIDDTESLNEKYNVRTLKEVKNLTEATSGSAWIALIDRRGALRDKQRELSNRARKDGAWYIIFVDSLKEMLSFVNNHSKDKQILIYTDDRDASTITNKYPNVKIVVDENDYSNEQKSDNLTEMISDSKYSDPIRVKVKIDTSNAKFKNGYDLQAAINRTISSVTLHPEILVDESDGSYQLCFPGKSDWLKSVTEMLQYNISGKLTVEEV